LVRGLLEAGYTGDFDVELFGQHIEPGAYDELVTSSLEFFERVLLPA
jgi:sugar phosphate isomerase/epimerase